MKQIHVKVPDDLAEEAKSVLQAEGFNFSSAIKLFFLIVVREGRFPLIAGKSRAKKMSPIVYTKATQKIPKNVHESNTKDTKNGEKREDPNLSPPTTINEDIAISSNSNTNNIDISEDIDQPINHIDRSIDKDISIPVDHTYDNKESTNITDNVCVRLPLNDGTDYLVDREYVAGMATLFPDLDMDSEFAYMRAWLLSNPSKRKTRRGIKAYIGRWLTKSDAIRKEKAAQANANSSFDANDFFKDAVKKSYEELKGEENGSAQSE